MPLTTEPQPVSPPRSPGEGDRGSAAWDVRRGPGNYLALVVTQAVGSVLAFAALWVATRALGPAGYGGVAAILAASQCVGQIAVQWTAVSVVRYGCEEFVQTGRVAATFWTRLLILVPSLLLVIALSAWWLPYLAAWLHIPSDAQPVVLAHLCATAVWGHVQHTLQAAKLPRVQGALLAAERAQLLLLLVALVITGTASPLSVAWAYTLVPMITAVIGLRRIRSLVYPGVRLDGICLGRILRFSYPLLPNSLFGYLTTNYLDALFIAYFLSTADLGRYSVAYQFAGTVMQLPILAGSLLLPFFITLRVNEQEDSIYWFLRDVLPLLSLLWSLGCALLAVIGGELVHVLFGPRFAAVTPIVWPLMVMCALAGPAFMGYCPVNSARSATSVAAAAGAVSACANVALNLLLIPRWSLMGCAWASAGAYGAGVLTMAYLVHRQLPRSRTWCLQAATPALVGAVYASCRSDGLGALGAAFLAGGLIMLLHRRSICSTLSTCASGSLVRR